MPWLRTSVPLYQQVCAVAEVLLVSKPVAPPWTDGAKNLVRHLITNSSGRHKFRCMVPKGQHPPGANSIAEGIYSDAGHYSPGISQNLRVLWRLAKPDKTPIYHFFFAPNPRTNQVASALFKLKNRKVVHTVVSEPNGNPPWFADVHVALSERTREKLVASGAPDVRLIRPGIPMPKPITEEQKHKTRTQLGFNAHQPLVLFAGDLTEHGGSEVLANAVKLAPSAQFIFACRPKGLGHAERQKVLEQKLGNKALWLGEIDYMDQLVASVDLQCLPATDLSAKMDLPMVLMEGMANGVPAIISDVQPLSELGTETAGVITTPPNNSTELAAAIESIVQNPDRHRQLGTAAQKYAKEHFSAKSMANKYELLYDELLESNGAC